MEKVKCADCGKEEEYNMKPGYPRKYCFECSAKKKAEFEGKGQPQVNKQEVCLLSQKDVQITAQTMMKCNFYTKAPKDLDEIYEVYQYFVKKLENNG